MNDVHHLGLDTEHGLPAVSDVAVALDGVHNVLVEVAHRRVAARSRSCQKDHIRFMHLQPGSVQKKVRELGLLLRKRTSE